MLARSSSFRLSYIKQIHDLLCHTLPTQQLLRHFRHQPLESTIRGLDIGTGASAIYPVLGVACFPGWSFVATDIDRTSIEHASENVVHRADNADRIHENIALVHVDEADSFAPKTHNDGLDRRVGGKTSLMQDDAMFHFAMCNPPFYSSVEEMDKSAQLKKQPPNAVSLCASATH